MHTVSAYVTRAGLAAGTRITLHQETLLIAITAPGPTSSCGKFDSTSGETELWIAIGKFETSRV